MNGVASIGVTARAALEPDGTPYRNVAPYLRAVARAGGETFVPENDVAQVDAVLERSDGLLFSGGSDLDPASYGAVRHPLTEPPNEARDVFELALMRGARERGVPVLAICRGLEVANVAFGGTLVQHIPDLLGPGASIGHSQTAVYALNREEYAPGHIVRLRPGSRLEGVLGLREFPTNSMHHQAVARVAPELTVAATTDDGIVEALDARFASPFFVAVQWHPEALPAADEVSARLFAAFVAAARNRAGRRALAK